MSDSHFIDNDLTYEKLHRKYFQVIYHASDAAALILNNTHVRDFTLALAFHARGDYIIHLYMHGGMIHIARFVPNPNDISEYQFASHKVMSSVDVKRIFSKIEISLKNSSKEFVVWLLENGVKPRVMDYHLDSIQKRLGEHNQFSYVTHENVPSQQPE